MDKNTLQKILNDKTSGSSEILINLNNYFKKIIVEPDKFRLTIQLAKKKFSHFSSIDNYLKSLEKIYSIKDQNELKDFINSFDKEHQTKYQQLYKNAKPILQNIKTVIAISNSKTLIEVFKLWRKDNKQLKVIVCESRPKNEGRIFAKVLLKENIKVEFITDFMISLYIPKVDAVILGADSILKNGSIINKVGSYTAAVICRHFKKPCYVLTTKEKLSSKLTFNQKEQSKSEVWNYKHKSLTIKNLYFEEVPKKYITKIISD
ncbi:MAG: hypothetical protein M1480_04380 [Bacteroidetes bacterium]|nr:hypothetical protein [Bacteroidota bacterium]